MQRVTPIARQTLQRSFATTSTTNAKDNVRVAIVDGVRTPFKLSGTDFNDKAVYDLSRVAMKSLLERNVMDGSEIDYVTWGNVIQEVTTSNIAREAALGAGIPKNVPAHTVTMACISSNLIVWFAVRNKNKKFLGVVATISGEQLSCNIESASRVGVPDCCPLSNGIHHDRNVAGRLARQFVKHHILQPCKQRAVI